MFAVFRWTVVLSIRDIQGVSFLGYLFRLVYRQQIAWIARTYVIIRPFGLSCLTGLDREMICLRDTVVP